MSDFEAQLKSRDEEQAIIMDGMRAEYEEQISVLRASINEQRIHYET